MEIRLLLVPYDSGQRNVRMGAGPEHLRAAGLEEHLAGQGHKVDVQVIEPASMNWRAEVQTSFELMRSVAEHVRAARADGRFPIVLSGNCLAAVGVIAGLGAPTGVMWIDAHGDFNTPQTTMSGFLDGMTLATATGRCWVELARSIEGFEPVPDKAVVMFGTRDLDPGEASALARSGIVRLSAEAAPDHDRSRAPIDRARRWTNFMSTSTWTRSIRARGGPMVMPRAADSRTRNCRRCSLRSPGAFRCRR